MNRASRAFALASFASVACGGNAPAPKATAAAPSASAAPSAKPQSTATGFLASDVPMATMPPAFDFGSKKAELRVYSASDSVKTSCASSAAVNASPSTDVANVVKACAAATSLKPTGAALTGSQKPDAVAQRFPFAAQAGRCYRAYGSAAAGVTDFSVFLLDSAGATAASGHAEGTRATAPGNGAVCFKEADAAQVVVTVGRGAGAFAVQVVSD